MTLKSLFEPTSSRWGGWRFRLLGVPVRVEPWFWAVALLIGIDEDLGVTLVWVAVCFVSVLLHEMGHAAAFRAFGGSAEVVLYGWGGVTLPSRNYRRTTFANVAISLAGPIAGFCFGGLVVLAASLSGLFVQLRFVGFGMPSIAMQRMNILLSALVIDLLYVNVVWGIVNLLPIYPFDGGHVLRTLLASRDANSGIRRSLLISAIVAALVAVAGLMARSFYIVIAFGILAAGSAQMLEDEPRSRPDPGRRW